MKKTITFVLFSVLCFCIFYGIRYIENPVQSQAAVSEVYESKIDTAGYIVRTEQVYNAPAAGTIYHYVQEGTRVKKNRVLSTIYTGNVSEETLKELENLNKRIADLESAGSNYTVSGLSSEEGIENIKNNIISARQGGNVSKIESYKAQINGIITGTVQEQQTDDINALREKKQSLEASIQSSKSDIYSQMSGVFSKNVDGLENVLTPKNVMSYKLSDYTGIADMVKEYKNQASSGQPVCKVVNNHIWYVLLTVDKNAAKDLQTGQNVKLRFRKLPGIEADATVEYISTEESETEKNVVALKCEQYKEGVFSTRFSEMELILESYEGFRVPVSAIRLNDGKTGVIVKNGVSPVFKECKVIYTDTASQTVIISPSGGGANLLREYDNIVVGEK